MARKYNRQFQINKKAVEIMEDPATITLAHEVAHLQLHRDYITGEVHVDKAFSETILKRDGASASGTERLEIEATSHAD